MALILFPQCELSGLVLAIIISTHLQQQIALELSDTIQCNHGIEDRVL